MNEHNLGDPLFFKGQMAARYKERMSMGFAVDNSKKGDSDMPNPAPPNHSPPTFVEAKQAASRESEDQGRRAHHSRASLSKGHLCPSRSKSSLDEQHTSGNKPSMKDLITKFEARSLTSGQFKDEDRLHMTSDTFGTTGCPRLLIDLDPAAVICSSLSDVDNSKSSPSLYKPPEAQISRAALSLNGETRSARTMERSQRANRPTSELSKRVTTDNPNRIPVNSKRPISAKGLYATSSSHLEGEEGYVEAASYEKCAGEDAPKRNALLPGTTDAPDDSSAPLRMSLRTAVNRKNSSDGNKYVVHKKDWAKRLPVWQKEGVTINTNSSQDFQSNFNTGLSKGDLQNSGSNDQGDNMSSRNSEHAQLPHSSSTQLRLTPRSSSLHNDKPDEAKDAEINDKHRTKAMERYLHFLKSSNVSQQNNSTTDVKNHPTTDVKNNPTTDVKINSTTDAKNNSTTDVKINSTTEAKNADKFDHRKAQRPPTPHRLLHLRKGSNSVLKGSFHQIKDMAQSSSTQDEAGSTRRPQKVVKSSQILRRGQRWKLVNATEKKDVTQDASGGDFYANAPPSSSNSLDSSLFEYQNNTSPHKRIGQPKSEDSDTRFGRVGFPAKKKSKVSVPVGRCSVAKNIQKAYQSRSHSARTHEPAEKKSSKQPLTSLMRGRSSSASKTPDSIDAIKTISLLGMSPKSLTSLSSNPMGPLTHNSPSHNCSENGKKNRSLKCDASDIGSVILTEDELADNDLVPAHLRETKPRDQPRRTSVAVSSSNDSCSRRSVTPLSKFMASQFRKTSIASRERLHPAIIEDNDPLYADKHDAMHALKQSLSNQVTRTNLRSSLERRRPSDFSKLFAKGRALNTPTKNISREPSFDDSSNHRNNAITNSRVPHAPMNSHTKLGRTVEAPHTLTKKEILNLTKESLNLATSVASRDDRAHSNTREGRERKAVEDAINYQDFQTAHRRADNHQAAGEGPSEKAFLNLHARQHEQPRESPTKKTFRQFLNGQNPSALKEYPKERGQESVDIDAIRELQYIQENALHNYFHFGQNDGKQGDTSEPDTKTEKLSTSSPLKKKRKADQPKKTSLKKKKKVETDIDLPQAIVAQKLSPERRILKVLKDGLKGQTKEEVDFRIDPVSKVEKFESPMRRRSSGDVCSKSQQSSRKDVSRDNSAGSGVNCTSVNTDSRTSPRKELCSTSDKSPQERRRPYSPSSTGIELRAMPKMPCDLDFKPPPRSQIPLLILNSATPRRKLDRLIQYRRWREAMLDCMRPSRLPLSDSFRKTLDSAVMEEWAMHCWQPSKDMYVDSQGVWWSASYQEIETPGGIPESLLGGGRPLSKEWILDLTARLPYLKIGPVRFLHAAYAFVAGACLTLGHMGFRLYHCGGDDYEYYCPDDDLECLMEMFSHNIR